MSPLIESTLDQGCAALSPLPKPCLNPACCNGVIRRRDGWTTTCSACDGFGYMESGVKAGAARYFQMLTHLAQVQTRSPGETALMPDDPFDFALAAL